jgi:transcriptional regulator with XRE-family HTH domain
LIKKNFYALHGPERCQNQALAKWWCHDKAIGEGFVMGIYDIFARNLRRQCSEFASIAEVCRGIGINRQQFNKYLAGQILPNSRTLRRISEYLCVSEVELFQDIATTVLQPIPEFSGTSEFETLLHSFIPHLKADLNVLKEGYYFCYFPLQSRNYLIRALLKVKNKNGVSYFTRLSLNPSLSNPKISLARGKHIGVVLATAQEIYLLGKNKRSDLISLITIDRSFTYCAPVLQGMALTRSANAQVACRVMVDFIGAKINLKQAIRKLGPVSIEDREMNPKIVHSLATNSETDPKQLTAIDNQDLMFR